MKHENLTKRQTRNLITTAMQKRQWMLFAECNTINVRSCMVSWGVNSISKNVKKIMKKVKVERDRIKAEELIVGIPFMCGLGRDQSNSYAFHSISLLFGLFLVMCIFLLFIHLIRKYIILFFFFLPRCGLELTGVMIVWCVDTAHKAWTLCISTANGFFSFFFLFYYYYYYLFLTFFLGSLPANSYMVPSIRYSNKCSFSVFSLSPLLVYLMFHSLLCLSYGPTAGSFTKCLWMHFFFYLSFISVESVFWVEKLAFIWTIDKYGFQTFEWDTKN